MATVLVHAGVAAGAMGAILSGRFITDATVESYSNDAIVARLIADAVVTHAAIIDLTDNMLLGSVDPENIGSNMEIVCAQIAGAVLHGRDLLAGVSTPPVATDFTIVGSSITCAIKAFVLAAEEMT